MRAVADLLAPTASTPQVGVHGLDTALRASTGSGGPTVAVLAEYDALPGIGHGCGHNVICSAAVGAFLGLHAVLSGGDLPGTAVLLGTPAEEGGGGKELMARDGAFDGVDAVVMLHPFSYDAAVQPFLGRRQLRVTYTGIAAHASAQPFMGRNALDAVVAGYSGRGDAAPARAGHRPGARGDHRRRAAAQRRPGDRERAVLRAVGDAGDAGRPQPPDGGDRGRRGRDDRLRRTSCTGTSCRPTCRSGPTWSSPPAGPGTRPDAAAPRCRRGSRRRRWPGSTDLGNVSVRVPADPPDDRDRRARTPRCTPPASPRPPPPRPGTPRCSTARSGLALTALDVLADPAVLAAARAEFEAAGGVLDVGAVLGPS